MPTFPHSRLFIGLTHSVLISGPHIQILETQTGNGVYSTARLEGTEKEALLKAGPVRCAAVDAEFKHVVTSGEDKQLKVWEIEGLKLVSERELPKKPTEIRLTRDGQTILVSDKFGDIFSYPLHQDLIPTSSAELGTSKRGSLTSHENLSNGKLILGHTSLLTTFTLTTDEKYIISADRDEHIRISWYPQGHVIERYCLGHTKYVSAVHVPSFAPSTLLSGGGDPTIKLWDWMSGDLLADIPIGAVVEPYIKVKAPTNRFGCTNNEDEGQEKVEKPGRRKGKGRRGGKEKEATEGGEGLNGEQTTVYVEGEACEMSFKEAEGEISTNADTEEPATSGETPINEAPLTAETEKLVLALQCIESLDVPEEGKSVVFSATGATALFSFRFPSLLEAQHGFPMAALDLGKPIINFTVEQDGNIWVLVDGERPVEPADQHDTDDKRAVRLVRWQDGKFAEVTDAGKSASLLSSLNSACLPATPADLKLLDVYSALVSLPKNVDAEHDPMRRGAYDNMDLDSMSNVDDAFSRAGTPHVGSKKGKAREPSQRELARMKKKRAVLAKVQEQEQAKATAGLPSAEEEPEPKKAKADEAVSGETQVEASGQIDVVMGEAV